MTSKKRIARPRNTESPALEANAGVASNASVDGNAITPTDAPRHSHTTQTLLGVREAAVLAGITRDELDRLVERGAFPAPAAVIGRIRGWTVLQIIEWSTSTVGIQARSSSLAPKRRPR